MSRFSKYLLLFFLINIPSGVCFAWSCFSPLTRSCCDIPVLHHPLPMWRAESAPGHLVWLLGCCLVTQVPSDGFYSTLGMQQDSSEVPSSSQEYFWRFIHGWARGSLEFWLLLLHKHPTSANSIPSCQPAQLEWENGTFRTWGCGTCPSQCRSVVELGPQ